MTLKKKYFSLKKQTNTSIWEGEKLNKKNMYNVSGILSVYCLSELENKLKCFIDKCDGVYLNKNI